MARILVSMPDDFLKSIDKIALTEQRTRSELIREALRSYITRSQVRKSGLTFAPEAGTQRLRDVINKNITEKEIEKIFENILL